MSMLKMAVCEYTWMSPVQPRRSSRCGQSVGALIRLPRWVHRMADRILLSSGLEHSNWLASGLEEWKTRPSRSSRAGLRDRPVTST